MRNVLRMSSAGSCRLQIAHQVLETPRLYQDELAMRMGTNLEPVVNWRLEEKGLTTHFAKMEPDDPQLEVETFDPDMMGHPDGIVSLDGELTSWLEQRLPEQALRILEYERQPMLHEVKTMNGNTFAQVQSGGLESGAFTSLYLDQINSYLASLNEGMFPNELQELLDERDWKAPTTALVTSFSPASRKFHFEVVEYDQEKFHARSRELEEVVIALDEGRLPEPDYDGGAAYCYFCPFAHLCPAAQERRSQRSFDDIILVEDEMGRVDELAGKYDEIRGRIADLEGTRDELKEQIEGMVPVGARIKAGSYQILRSEVKGRTSPDLEAIAKKLGVTKKTLPTRRGRGHVRLNVDLVSE